MAIGAKRTLQEIVPQPTADNNGMVVAVQSGAYQLVNPAGLVLNDGVITSENGWSSMQIVKTLCPPFTVSGATVQCTPVANYPLGVQVEITPMQEGTGDPSPENVRPIVGRDSVSVIRCGKNLLDISNMQTITRNGVTFQLENGGIHVSGTATGNVDSPIFKIFLSSGTYIDNMKKANFSWLLGTSFVVQRSDGSNYYYTANQPFTIKEDEKPLYWYFMVRNGATLDEIVYPQIELGSTTTAYEPYQGNTYTVWLGQTVYGGTLDVRTGTLTVTHGEIAAYNGEALPGEWISDRDVYATGTQPSIGAQVVYDLVESQTIQLAPQQIIALSGTNTLYADAGNITVTGASDPIATITALQNRVSALESAQTNM